MEYTCTAEGAGRLGSKLRGWTSAIDSSRTKARRAETGLPTSVRPVPWPMLILPVQTPIFQADMLAESQLMFRGSRFCSSKALADQISRSEKSFVPTLFPSAAEVLSSGQITTIDGEELKVLPDGISVAGGTILPWRSQLRRC